MAWYLFGKESKNEKRIRELEEKLTPTESDADDNLHPDGGVNQVSPLEDDGTPFVELRGEWDSERQGFIINIDWNAPYLKHMIPMGVEGETDFEVAAYGVSLLAHQILETEQMRRANEDMQIREAFKDD